MAGFGSIPDAISTFSEGMKKLNRRFVKISALANGLEPPNEDPHPKTVKWAHAAHPHLDSCTSVDMLKREVAQEEGGSHKTAGKWLCRRMPDELYNPGTYSGVDERYKALRRAIRRIHVFIESP